MLFSVRSPLLLFVLAGPFSIAVAAGSTCRCAGLNCIRSKSRNSLFTVDDGLSAAGGLKSPSPCLSKPGVELLEDATLGDLRAGVPLC